MRILFALLLSGLIAFPVRADDACITYEAVAKKVTTESAGSTVVRVTGVDAANLAAGIGKLVGQDLPTDSEFLVAKMPDGIRAYVVMFENGCATHHGKFLVDVVAALIAGPAA